MFQGLAQPIAGILGVLIAAIVLVIGIIFIAQIKDNKEKEQDMGLIISSVAVLIIALVMLAWLIIDNKKKQKNQSRA